MSTVKRFIILLIFALSLAAAMLLTYIPAYRQYKNGDIRNFNLAEAGSLQSGELVEGEIALTFGACAEEYETTFGIRLSKNSSKLYYVVLNDNDKFILYETSSKEEFQTLDGIADETIAYLSDDSEEGEVMLPEGRLHVTGTVKEIPSSILGYYREWYEDIWDDGEFDQTIEPVMIAHTNFNRLLTMIIIGGVCAFLAVLTIIVSVVALIKSRRA